MIFSSPEPLSVLINIFPSRLMGGQALGIYQFIIIDSYSPIYLFSLHYGLSRRNLIAPESTEH